VRKSKFLTADTLAELGADSAAGAIDPEIKRLKRGTSLVDYRRMPAFARDLARRCVFCRRRVTGSPLAQISAALE
jgi:hypothetical protein